PTGSTCGGSSRVRRGVGCGSTSSSLTWPATRTIRTSSPQLTSFTEAARWSASLGRGRRGTSGRRGEKKIGTLQRPPSVPIAQEEERKQSSQFASSLTRYNTRRPDWIRPGSLLKLDFHAADGK